MDSISNPEAKKKKTKQNEIVKTIKEKATKKQITENKSKKY